MTAVSTKKSDLGVRTLSAVVMIAVAGTALWLGGWVWTAFVAAVALGVLWEWWGLVRGFAQSISARSLWLIGGLVYIGVSAAILAFLGRNYALPVIWLILLVIAVDVGAYFAGRTIGGPKIAPRISPSKTWAGLAGAIILSTIVALRIQFLIYDTAPDHWVDWENWYRNMEIGGWSLLFYHFVFCVLFATVAQAGDFFESWMKRRAGVKDSGNLIPGHGGLFDRVDGLLAVCFVLGLMPLSFYAYDCFRLGMFK